MQRIKTVVADTGNGRVRITIESNTAALTRDEVTEMMDSLTDQSMRMLNQTRYIWAPLCRIKVKGR